MVITKEYRIPLPLTVEEFHRGQLYAVAECSKNETGGGEGAEFVKQEDFVSSSLLPGTTLTGTYTHKIYRCRSKAPWLLQKTLPAEAFEVHEESWNAYPYCKTVLTNPGYMKKDLLLTIESIHLPDNGSSKNPLNAGDRDIIHLDICDDRILFKKDYDAAEDPKLFRSSRTARGPLPENWIHQTSQPIMCAYKLVTIHFKWTGLTSIFEKTVQKQYPRIFAKFHRQAYAWIDRWYDMTLTDIRLFEDQTAIDLRIQMAEKEKRGTTCNDERNVVTARA